MDFKICNSCRLIVRMSRGSKKII
ncbi:TPA: hypothetical protein DEF17_02690 [bacterium]|nr:hypothetical protein [bacterium]